MNFASTCLNQILDLNPQSVYAVMKSEGIPTLCRKLSDFENGELQQNSIKSLQIMSQKFSECFHGQHLIQNLLDMFDFFELNVQVPLI